jgi:hypothetical protein
MSAAGEERDEEASGDLLRVPEGLRTTSGSLGDAPPDERWSHRGHKLVITGPYQTSQPARVRDAKQLGCSLEEITDLVTVWDGDQCGPVQRRFHELITDKIRTARRQVVELSAFAAQLQAAAEQLSGEPVDGPCGEDCACVTPTTGAASNSTTVTLVAKPLDEPIACTLEPDAMGERLADWNATLARATARIASPDGGLRIEFDDDIDLGSLARLVAAEQHCCAFLSFALTVDHRGLGLEVRAPADAAGIVDELFGDVA